MKKLKLLIFASILVVVGVLATFHWITYKAKGLTYNDVDSIPKNKVGLVLGASRLAPSGNINLFYKHRVDAAVALSG